MYEIDINGNIYVQDKFRRFMYEIDITGNIHVQDKFRRFMYEILNILYEIVCMR